MRKRQRVIFLAICLTLLWSIPTFAQEIIEVTPSQLTVSANRQQTTSRTLLIRANEMINNISIIPLDLKNDEGSQVLPAQAIRVEGGAKSLDSNGLLTIVINIDLTNVPSGQYAGDLLISYENGNRLVPITVTVKDPPLIPALVLIAGVGLGLIVSEYRSKGKPRDEILVNLGQIRTQIKVDEDLLKQGKVFFESIEAELVDVEVALEAQQWEDAKTAIGKARTVWNLWRRGRSDWLVQFTAYDNLVSKLQQLGGKNSHYIANLLQTAEDVHRATPTHTGPDELRQQLLSLYATTNGYVELQDAIEELASIGPGAKAQALLFKQELDALKPDTLDAQKNLRNRIDAAINTLHRNHLENQLGWLAKTCAALPEETANRWSATLSTLQNEFENLPTGDPLAFHDLAGRITAVTDAILLLPDTRTLEDQGHSLDFELAPKDIASRLSKLTNVPDITLRTMAEKVASAGSRLRAFMVVTYAVAVILLALAGFVELYVARSTFGSNSITDYFGLLAWGFGAEATRSAITEMVESWGLVRK